MYELFTLFEPDALALWIDLTAALRSRCEQASRACTSLDILGSETREISSLFERSAGRYSLKYVSEYTHILRRLIEAQKTVVNFV